jgi:hypothetical protein
MNKAIIYAIKSYKITDIYIGSTIKYKERQKQHFNNKDLNNTSLRIISQGDAYFEILEEFEYNNNKDIFIKEQYYLDLYKDNIVNCRSPYRDENTIDCGYFGELDYYNTNIGCITEKAFIHETIRAFWREQSIKHNKWIEEYKQDINYKKSLESYKTYNNNKCISRICNSDNIIFEIENVNNIEGNNKKECIKNSLKFIGHILLKNIDNITQFITYIKENNLPIDIISNTVHQIKLKGNIKEFTYGKYNFPKDGYKLSECEYDLKYIYKSQVEKNNSIYLFIYDSKTKYVDVIKNNICIVKSNLYFDKFDIFRFDNTENYKIIKTPRELYEESIREIH